MASIISSAHLKHFQVLFLTKRELQLIFLETRLYTRHTDQDEIHVQSGFL